MRKTMYIASIIALLSAMMVITPAAAEFEPGECDITVCASGCDYSNIDTAVDAANPGDTVCVYNGTYGEHVNIGKPNTILKGEGAEGAKATILTGAIVIGMGPAGEADASGTVLEGFKITGNMAEKPLAPNCIIRNNVFDTAQPIGLGGFNTTFENNVVLNLKMMPSIASNSTLRDNIILNATWDYFAMSPTGSYITIVNNTIKGSIGAAISLDGESTTCENNIVTKNNIISNDYAGIELWMADSGNKMYLNNFVDNGVTATTSGTTPPAVTYWNSTEQIEYVYDSYEGEDYLGNYWSDYAGSDTTPHDGIGDTAYDIPGSGTDKDYRPLMAGYENYPAPAGPEPTPTPTPTPGPTGVPEFSPLGLIALIGVLSVLLAGTTIGRGKRRQ